MTDTKHTGTPPDFKNYINPEQRERWESDLQDWLQEDRDPNRETRAAFWFLLELMQYENSYAALAEENALRTNKLAEILRLEVDGEEFYIPAEPGPLGPFESLEEAAKEFMEFMDRTDKKMREENALLRKALEITLKLLTEEVFSSSEHLVQRCAEVGLIVRAALEVKP